MIHGSNEREGAGCTNQIVAAGQQTEILSGITVREYDFTVTQLLMKEGTIQMRVVTTNVYGDGLVRMQLDEMADDIQVLLI